MGEDRLNRSRPFARLRALVLAAGFGTRLHPLTETVPKPLLPIRGTSVLERTLDRLVDLGCEAIAVNLHHRGEHVRSAIGTTRSGVPIHYSEERSILGTLGCLHPLRGFFAPADLVVLVNGDSLCEWPLGELVQRHAEAGAVATLLFSTRADPGLFGGGVVVAEGRVVSFDATSPVVGQRLVFAGAHLLEPSLLARVPARPADIVPELYRPLLDEGAPLAAEVTDRSWHDLGTPQRLLEAVLDGLDGGSWTGPRARVDPSARLHEAVVEGDAVIGPEARLDGVLVLPGARIGARAVLRRVIVGPGVSIEPGSELEARLVSREGDRRLGGRRT